MLLLNYTISENYVPPEIYQYSDNERYLLILFGNAIIHIMRTSISLNSPDEGSISPLMKEITERYINIIKEKEDIITQLESSKRITIDIYKDLIETEKDKINTEIQKEIEKERQYMYETTKLLKENYEQTILSLKNDKENMKNEMIIEMNNKSLSEKEEYNEIRSIIKEQTEEIRKLENEKIRLEEKIKYDEQLVSNEIQSKDILIFSLKKENEIEILKKEKEYESKEQNQRDVLMSEINSLKIEIQNLTNDKDKERYEWINENNKKNEETMVELHKTIEEIKQQTVKKGISQDIGKTGETYFFELAMDVFGDMEEFELEDTTKKGHMGDFILKFKEFNIMVDCKNFNNSKVSKVDILKFKSDSKTNQHIRIAWMVSLNKSISTHDKYTIDTEFENGVLFCYINSLYLWEENQRNFLICCWKFCKEIYVNFFDKENENTDKITALLKRENNRKLVAEKGRKKIKEMKAITEQLKTTIYDLEKDLIEIIKGDILMEDEDKRTNLKNWWNQYLIREDSKKNKIEIETIYEKYKESNEYNEEYEGDINNFILILKSFIKEEDFSKSKTKGSKKYILNHKYIL